MSAEISRRSFVAAGLAIPAGIWGRWGYAAEEPLDLAIVGGTVIDGTGTPRRQQDLGIRAGRIVSLGNLMDVAATKRILATDRIVSPGFIDIHTHSDRTLLNDPTAQSGVRQGATTHVIGNCGSSPTPLVQAGQVSGRTMKSYGDFLDAIRESKPSLNVCGLVGHNTVREAVMGMQNRQPSESELTRMRDLIADAMRAGAVGMSTGLVSPPGSWSLTEEIIELAKVAGRMGGIYASHMRGEASTVVDSVREALRIGREGKVPVEISHHKAAGKENWGKTRETLPLIEQAVRDGVVARLDVYPYRAGSAGLSQLVPPWAHEGGTGAMLERLQNPATRARIAKEMATGSPDWPNFFQIDWDDIQITTATSTANRKWIGKKVGDVARDRGCPGIEACIDLIIEEKSSIGMINFIMDEEEVRRVLKHPLSMIGSDGFALDADKAQGSPHPRCYGCFPRAIGKYSRELGILSLETVIHKMTQMPADQLGLTDRGVIKKGAAADLVVFDSNSIIDRATFESPHQYPSGIDWVLVNGEVVVDHEKHTGARPGKVLSPNRG